jgi:diguanylate cyclase (GGDEF)-like protein/PAS domain S-box-containing protein
VAIIHPDITDASDLYQALVENSTELIALLDPGGEIRFINRASEEVLGYPPEEMVGNHYSDFIDPADRQLAAAALAQISSGRPRVRREVSARHRDGLPIHFSLNARPLAGRDGEMSGIVLILSDLTDQHRLRERLEAQANEDDLTKLPNRRRFLGVVEDQLGTTEPGERRGAVLMLDVDGLKTVNDLHGHAAGDRFIIEAARRLGRAIGDSEILARLRGDEFAILMPEAGPEHAIQRAESLLRAIAEEEFDVGVGLSATASVGACLLRGEATVDEVLREVDGALYQAKRRGGNRAVLA